MCIMRARAFRYSCRFLFLTRWRTYGHLLLSFMLVLGLVSPDRKHEFDILIVLHIHGGKKMHVPAGCVCVVY